MVESCRYLGWTSLPALLTLLPGTEPGGDRRPHPRLQCLTINTKDTALHHSGFDPLATTSRGEPSLWHEKPLCVGAPSVKPGRRQRQLAQIPAYQYTVAMSFMTSVLAGVVSLASMSTVVAVADQDPTIPFSATSSVSAADSSYATSTTVERVVKVDILLASSEQRMWCPDSHPWVKQDVQSVTDGDAAVGWQNTFPGFDTNTYYAGSTASVTGTRLANGDGRWGIHTTVVKHPLRTSGEARLVLHCSSDPNYNPYRMKVAGTPPEFRYGQPYEYQLIVTGDNEARVGTITGLPSGLQFDSTGRIYGTPTEARAGNYPIQVHLVNKYVAHRPAQGFTLSLPTQRNFTAPGNSDTFESINLAEDSWPEDGREIWCPAATPYLINQDLAPGRAVPRGVSVTEHDLQSGMIIVSGLIRTRDNYQAGVWNLSASLFFAKSGSVHVHLHCTNNASEAATP